VHYGEFLNCDLVHGFYFLYRYNGHSIHTYGINMFTIKWIGLGGELATATASSEDDAREKLIEMIGTSPLAHGDTFTVTESD